MIVLKNSKRILRLSTSSPANGSERIKSFFPEIKARARSVRLISPVDIYFIPRSRIFSTPQSFTAGNASIFFAISGICEPFLIGPVIPSAIKILPVLPMSTPPSIYSLSSSFRSSSIKSAALSRETTSHEFSKMFE